MKIVFRGQEMSLPDALFALAAEEENISDARNALCAAGEELLRLDGEIYRLTHPIPIPPNLAERIFAVIQLVAGAGLITAIIAGAIGVSEKTQIIVSVSAAFLVLILNRLGYLPGKKRIQHK